MENHMSTLEMILTVALLGALACNWILATTVYVFWKGMEDMMRPPTLPERMDEYEKLGRSIAKGFDEKPPKR